MQKKKVLLLATGGTIACTHSQEGLAPGLSGAGILKLLPELREGFTVCVDTGHSNKAMRYGNTPPRPMLFESLARRLQCCI